MKKKEGKRIIIIIALALLFILLLLFIRVTFSGNAPSVWPSISKANIMLSPKLITPSNNAEINNPIKFTWAKVYRADFYELQVALKTDPGFSNRRVHKFLTGVSYTPNFPLDADSYIWRVRGRNRVSTGQWSSISYFNVVEPVIGTFSDDFSSYIFGGCLGGGTRFGPWNVVYHGYGCVKIEDVAGNKMLHENTARSIIWSEIHASLVTGPGFSDSFNFEVKIRTEEQLRTPTPEMWEVAWVLWHYTDNTHFYYFSPKPNGWELGKEDPAYPGDQRFLATGSSPSFPIKKWYNIKINQVNNLDGSVTIKAYVNDVLITTFTDTERPYTSGKIALYNEDAHVHFDDVKVSLLGGPSAAN